MLFILHAGEKKTARNANNEGEEELPGVQEMGRCWSGCFAGGAAVEEEGADFCRGEGKLSAGAVGVTEEGTATSVAAGRRWRKELLLRLLLGVAGGRRAAVGRRWRKEGCYWPVKKLEGGGEAEVKICRWLCVDERERSVG